MRCSVSSMFASSPQLCLLHLRGKRKCHKLPYVVGKSGSERYECRWDHDYIILCQDDWLICQNQTIVWPLVHDVVTSDRLPCPDEVYLIAAWLKCKRFMYLRFLNYHPNSMLGRRHVALIMRLLWDLQPSVSRCRWEMLKLIRPSFLWDNFDDIRKYHAYVDYVRGAVG